MNDNQMDVEDKNSNGTKLYFIVSRLPAFALFSPFLFYWLLEPEAARIQAKYTHETVYSMDAELTAENTVGNQIMIHLNTVFP